MNRLRISLLTLLAIAGGWTGAARSRAADPEGAPALSTSDIASAVNSAWLAFLAGHLDEASSSFRYLATLGVAAPAPNVNLALLARDQGKPDEALPYIVKSSLEESAGSFIWNQRGWAYASLQRLPEARESFLKALDRSATTADQAEAKLGLGIVARM
ncbi:MAG: hypothetical protein WC881_06035, partial [Elusimicrobiota bacterium]